MDQYCVISKILSYLPISDYIPCLSLSREWNEVVKHSIGCLDNWQRYSIVVQFHAKSIQITDFDKLIYSCFCNERGLFFHLFYDGITLKIKMNSIHNLVVCHWVKLEVYFNVDIVWGKIEYHKVFNNYLIQIEKLLIDCTNIANIEIFKGQRNNIWSLSQVFFHLKTTNIPRLCAFDQTFPFHQTKEFFSYCYQRDAHFSLTDPTIFHYVVCHSGEIAIFSFKEMKIYREVVLSKNLINIYQSEMDQIIVSDKYLVILEDESDRPKLIIVDIDTKNVSRPSLSIPCYSFVELCPLINSRFMLLYHHKNYPTNYQIFQIGNEIKVIKTGQFNFKKPSKNFQAFKDFIRFDSIPNKLLYVNNHEISELFIE